LNAPLVLLAAEKAKKTSEILTLNAKIAAAATVIAPL
jgi:hypothetical protein